MEKIKINEIVDFQRKTSEKSKRNFVLKLKTRVPKERKETDDDIDPRDYWVTSTSTIYNVFKTGDDKYFDPKIEELFKKMTVPDLKNTTFLMYKRNRDILLNFKEFEVREFRPKTLKRQGVQTSQKILTILNFPLYVKPTIVFSHQRNGKDEIGALWLVSQKDGFKKSELGMFCEALHKFLIKHFSDKFQISDDYCIAIDTVNAQSVVYEDFKKQKLSISLDKTLDEMSKI